MRGSKTRRGWYVYIICRIEPEADVKQLFIKLARKYGYEKDGRRRIKFYVSPEEAEKIIEEISGAADNYVRDLIFKFFKENIT